MTTDFINLNLDAKLLQTLGELGYIEPTEIQARVIPLMLSGRDVVAQSQTGSGKTAAFALPILQELHENSARSGVHALVLSPTRELAIQVAEAIEQYGRGIRASVMPIYGGQHYQTSKRRIKQGVDVIVGTPGRLQDLMRQNIIDLGGVRTVVLDEADEMLSMGFIEDIENILSQTPSERQTTLFSATLPQAIRKLAGRYLNAPETIMVERRQMTVETIDQRYYLINENDKLAALTRLLESEQAGATLVFTRTRAGSGKLANELVRRGFPSEAIHGDLEQRVRIRVLDRFRTGQIQILAATDVAARGLDINDISHVFNYDLPTDPEAYVHRIGRTARAGKTGTAISLVTPSERRRLKKIESYIKKQIPQAVIPTEEAVQESRESKFIGKMMVWLERDRSKRELKMVEGLVAEGHDPLRVAAAALRMARAEENQRPLESISEVRAKPSGGNGAAKKKSHRKGGGKKHGKSSAPRGKGGRRTSHEQGMVRLSLARGRTQGIRPSEVVGEIARQAEIPGKVIGKILIQDQHTLVDVPEEFVSRVLGKTGSYGFRGQKCVTIERA